MRLLEPQKIELKKGHYYLLTRKGKQYIMRRRWWRKRLQCKVGDILLDLTEVYASQKYYVIY